MIGPPPLDCHAHISPDVTPRQLALLGPAVVFAVTRSPKEAKAAYSRSDQRMIWGYGAHPAFVSKGGDIDLPLLRRLLPRFALLGEIGLDRRSGHVDRQTQLLAQLLETVTNEPVLLSLHSNGCVDELLGALEAHPHPGCILHWFTGDEGQLERAVRLGCYFSVNAAMHSAALRRVPLDRMLPETDYPVSRASKGGMPGETQRLESAVALLHGLESPAVRAQWYRNLRTLSLSTGAIDRMPRELADLLVVA